LSDPSITTSAELAPTRSIWPSAEVRWLVWIIYAVTWTWALLRPYPAIVLDHPEFEWQFFLFSKTVHVSAFAVFAILSGWLRVPWRHRWALLLFLSAHAWSSEYFQHFVPTRTPALHDVGFDHLGILLGVGLTWKWWIGSTAIETTSNLG
jgi:VanZ family protein